MVDRSGVGKPVPPGTPVVLSGLPMMAATGGTVSEIEGDFVLTLTRPITGHVIEEGGVQSVAQIHPIAEILIS